VAPHRSCTADGRESTATLTFKYDGKPCSFTGSPDFDTVSKGGKTLTFSAKGTDASGVKRDDVSVYDRQ
jgi:hypothetical protein